MGGCGTGSSFTANIAALDAVKLNMRTLHDAKDPDTSMQLFGEKLALPLMAAPIGGVAFNMSHSVDESEYIAAVVRGCRAAGVLAGTGDGEQEKIHRDSCNEIKKAGGGIPFIKPWEDDEILRKAKMAREAGAETIGIDIDAAGLITLKLMGKPVFPRSFDELSTLIAKLDTAPILKGIMSVSEAEMACRAGAGAIVVSNHGGRVLDSCPGTAEVLPEIVDALGGQIPVLVDGGIRSGLDIFKMLALGADAVLIGRTVAIAAIGGGEDAVRDYILELQSQLYRTMMMTGCRSIDAINRSVLR